ncbi:MAG: heme ABC exporter ATP-binding protein CcmA [Mangrovicoccus sp.]|nr:heme ABC exporter ATP-binding protein CcmA [Mangrovicoccus sp.]
MLTVSGLACARGGVPILENLSFRLSAGAALVLRGPNGIGKTTLLRTVTGLQPPLAGQVDLAPDAVAYAGHADGIKAMLTVTENLRFWAGVFGTKDLAPALAAFDLERLTDRFAGTLSAGQKRRLGLARLAVSGRPLWVLDEPTVSLDAESTALFAKAVQRHCAQGGAALMATHIDLGFEAESLDLAPYRARLPEPGADDFDEAFL